MKHIKLFELHSLSDNSDLDMDTIYVLWNNGDLMVNPANDQRMQVRSGAVNAQLTRSKHQIFMMPMDDWADTKNILKIQQMLRDLMRAGFIDDEWGFVINDDTETVRSLGSRKVEDILKYDASFSQIIPFAFHGTTTLSLPKIELHGIQPRSFTRARPNWKKGYTAESHDRVYMTIDYRRAVYYAKVALDAIKKVDKHTKAELAVIMVKDLPTSCIVPDDDWKNNVSMMSLINMMNTGKKGDEGIEYIKGIRSSGQFALAKAIPANLITKIWKGDEVDPE